jgi:two-component system, sensor histidine kinase RegB
MATELNGEARVRFDGANSLRRLVALRWIAVSLQLAVALLAGPTLGIRLPALPIAVVLGLLAVSNLASMVRIRQGATIKDGEILLEACIDVAALTVLMYVAGGVTNPLISLYLPIIAVSATILPSGSVAIVVGLSVAAYSLLTVNYLPFEIADPHNAVHLHLTGMWLTFAFSAAIIGWFVARMMQAIRTRDAQLLAARETALRNERVVALGNLAAGAAHELGTPLGTIAIITGELLSRPGLDPALQEDLMLVRSQVAQCKKIITGLSARAGGSRAEGGHAVAVDAWIGGVIARWQAQRPQIAPTVRMYGDDPAPRVLADITLEQAFLNLFNNAADASPDSVDIEADWRTDRLALFVADRGPGIAPELVQRLGREPVTTRDEGAGIGVMLAYTAIERSGGTVTLKPRSGGGTLAEVMLPLKNIRID